VLTHHAQSLFMVRHSRSHVDRLMDGLNIGPSVHPVTHHVRMVLSSYALERVLQRCVGRHGH